jgi:Transglycosylase-like domain
MRPKTASVLIAEGALLAAPAAWAAPDNLLRHPVGDHVTVATQMRAEARDNRRDDLSRRAFRLARRVAGDNGERFHTTAERRRLRGLAPGELRARMRKLRDSRNATASPTLEAIAACESRGDPTTDTGNGFYGKYQFSLETWRAVGGTGNPARASEAEQNRRAEILYARAGASPWPVCGR